VAELYPSVSSLERLLGYAASQCARRLGAEHMGCRLYLTLSSIYLVARGPEQESVGFFFLSDQTFG
jgi:hypothetical protein